MYDKEWHRDRIELLKYRRNCGVNKHNRDHNSILAILSVTTVMLTFELSSKDKNVWWLLILYLCFVVLLRVIWKHEKYPEDDLIENNYEALLKGDKN